MDLASHPLVSVLLPVLNAATTLPACLRSIQRQTEPRWQCVLVDDGSDDESLACARWFAAQDPRFEVVAAAHQGLVSALRTGLAHCRGRFVARMDADDLMHRQRLSMQVRALEELRVRGFCQTFMLTLHCAAWPGAPRGARRDWRILWSQPVGMPQSGAGALRQCVRG